MKNTVIYCVQYGATKFILMTRRMEKSQMFKWWWSPLLKLAAQSARKKVRDWSAFALIVEKIGASLRLITFVQWKQGAKWIGLTIGCCAQNAVIGQKEDSKYKFPRIQTSQRIYQYLLQKYQPMN